jgi:hemoglobin/transferrin/lactoferrin receptor protein
MNKTYAAACMLAAALMSRTAPAAAADSAALRLDPVTVTARGYAAPQSQTPGGVGVVMQEDLARAPQASVADSLDRLPGIKRSGDSPWGQDISIRGLSGPSVVLLLNGKRLHTATDLNARLGFINPADIERVEVLKGPISALYGSGAVGGVVNIITRKADFTEKFEPHGRVSLSGATNPEGGNLYGGLSLSGPQVYGFISGAYRDYNDVYGGHNDRLDNSSFLDRQGRAVLGLRPWRPLNLRLEAMQSTGRNIGLPGGPASMPATAQVTYTSPEFTFFGLDADLKLDGTYLKSIETDLYYTRNKRRVRVTESVRPAAGAWPIEAKPAADHETYGGKLQTLSKMGGHTLTAGADFWLWQVETRRYRHIQLPAPNNQHRELYDSPTPDARQLSVGLFVEDNWSLNHAFTLNLGARLDRLNTQADPMIIIPPNPNAIIYQNSR